MNVICLCSIYCIYEYLPNAKKGLLRSKHSVEYFAWQPHAYIPMRSLKTRRSQRELVWLTGVRNRCYVRCRCHGDPRWWQIWGLTFTCQDRDRYTNLCVETHNNVQTILLAGIRCPLVDSSFCHEANYIGCYTFLRQHFTDIIHRFCFWFIFNICHFINTSLRSTVFCVKGNTAFWLVEVIWLRSCTASVHFDWLACYARCDKQQVILWLISCHNWCHVPRCYTLIYGVSWLLF